MLAYALIILLIGASGGLFMATRVLRGRFAPWIVSILHMLCGATGLTLLLLGVLQGKLSGAPVIALGVLTVTALLGFFLASIHFDKRVALKRYVFTHATFAITGVTLLIVAILWP